MNDQLNSEGYWDRRFSTGNWDESGGRDQTRLYAHALVRQLDLPPDFRGSILDFGCALGDAIPVYRQAYPNADLWGMDHSHAAIAQCQETYGEVAQFHQGDQNDLPFFDVIIASHILEHIHEDLEVTRTLLERCRKLFIVVPYKETPLCKEHVNYYDEDYYLPLGNYTWRIFPKTPAQLNPGFLVEYYLKNIARVCLGRKWRRRPDVILFQFSAGQTSGQPGQGIS